MDVTPIIIAVVSSGAFFTFIQFLITRRDNKKLELKGIKDEIVEIKAHLVKLDKKNEQQDARTSRTRILRFDDELVEGRQHSREYFLQILDDCEIYEAWAKANPEIKNGYAKAAVKHIRKTYDELIEKGAWKV